MTGPRPYVKQEGNTQAERHLGRLCGSSFLSLWSYPGIFRDQKQHGQGDGKEVCDLLVVFGQDIVIFSDKDCGFSDVARLDVAWSRWFRKAVLKSADQVWGAERWLRDHPGRVFLDRQCEQPLPVELPTADAMRVHRVVVAHDAARRCRELMGGSGSLVILPFLAGQAHVRGPVKFPDAEVDLYTSWSDAFRKEVVYDKTVLPFAVGDLDPQKPFVHVFDDVGLGCVLQELDTATDFVQYLDGRERFLRSGSLLMAAGEEDLLAVYLRDKEGYAARSFDEVGIAAKLIIPEGEWERLLQLPAWTARKRADEASYAWDQIIERFNDAILSGTSPVYPTFGFSKQELAVRAMAREPRLHRRVLAAALGDFLHSEGDMPLKARVCGPIREGSPYYVFLLVRREVEENRSTYRKRRQGIALAYLIQTKRKYADAAEVVVLATDLPGKSEESSEDVIYRGDEPLTAEEINSVSKYVAEQQILGKLGRPIEGQVLEYPPGVQHP